MRDRKKRTTVVIMICILLVVVSGCSKEKNSDTLEEVQQKLAALGLSLRQDD